ncbi:nucleoside deaminase [Candidatus Babeliales bacterium]|nr:nucleoside deaminase [Candidatus Babeliales bacterium]
MKSAYCQAVKAYNIDEVPIGAILVNDQEKIIARAFNQMEKKQTQLAHAEMLVLAKSAKKMKNWRLSGTTLYVSVQPCLMCLGALYLSRVSRVVYGVPSPKFGFDLNNQYEAGIYKNLDTKIEYLPYEKSKELLQIFFKKKRSLVHDE